MKKAVFVLGMALVVLAGCQPSPQPMPTSTPTSLPSTSPPATEEGSIPTTDSQVPRIKPQKLKERLDAGEDVIVVDAMSREDYERRHVRGALSIPLYKIEERHGELPKEKKIVLYCT